MLAELENLAWDKAKKLATFRSLLITFMLSLVMIQKEMSPRFIILTSLNASFYPFFATVIAKEAGQSNLFC